MFNDKIILKSQQVFRSDHHNVYTVEINKIALSSNNDKRFQIFDRVTKCPYGTNAVKVCKSEMLKVFEAKERLKMLSKEYESETYLKEICETLLKHVKTKCKSEMQKYVKLKKRKVN